VVYEGWRVRDGSDICLGYTTPLPTMITKVARRGLNVPRASLEESIAFASARSPDELLYTFDRIHRDNLKRGIAKLIRWLKDWSTISSITRTSAARSNVPEACPKDRLRAALQATPELSGEGVETLRTRLAA